MWHVELVPFRLKVGTENRLPLLTAVFRLSLEFKILKSQVRHTTHKVDYDEILYINDLEQSAVWLAKLRECRSELPVWVSDFHSQKLPC